MSHRVKVGEFSENSGGVLRRVRATGRSVVIEARGQPVAVLTPVAPATTEPLAAGYRVPGSAKGQIVIAEDFDETLACFDER